MGENHRCPPECKVRLRSLESHKDECVQDRKDTYKHWEEEIKKMIPQKTFFWLIGVLVLVLIAAFSVLYGQGSATNAKLNKVREEQIVVQTTLKSLAAHVERDSSRSSADSSEN